MKKTIAFSFAAVALLAGAATALSQTSPKPTAAASASASASAPASASAVPTYRLLPVPMPWLEGFPTETSPTPSADDWKGAAPVPLLRGARGCELFHVREWVRAVCRLDRMFKGLRVNAGPATDVTLDEEGKGAHAPLVVIFPVRPGDRRVLEVTQPFQEGRYADGEDAFAVISAEWLAGKSGPVIVVD